MEIDGDDEWEMRGFWVIDCSEDSSSILYHSKGLTHQKTVG